MKIAHLLQRARGGKADKEERLLKGIDAVVELIKGHRFQLLAPLGICQKRALKLGAHLMELFFAEAIDLSHIAHRLLPQQSRCFFVRERKIDLANDVALGYCTQLKTLCPHLSKVQEKSKGEKKKEGNEEALAKMPF